MKIECFQYMVKVHDNQSNNKHWWYGDTDSQKKEKLLFAITFILLDLRPKPTFIKPY